MRPFGTPAILAVPAALGSCLVVTGSTDGYTLSNTGSDGGACEGGASCGNPALECLSAADCTSDAGPQVCCFAPTTAGSACGPAPCAGSPAVQLCKGNTECGSESCVLQSCAFGGTTVTIQACGNVLVCSPL
ncbi:MAG: hypothetical protein ACLP1X_17320 [Polyangiaceae bacterium]|jgi:hypothetical protein